MDDRDEMKKSYYKKIGKSKDNIIVEATSWDGKDEVIVITPINPTAKEIKETTDFILHELDDHDAFDNYKNLFVNN